MQLTTIDFSTSRLYVITTATGNNFTFNDRCSLDCNKLLKAEEAEYDEKFGNLALEIKAMLTN